MQIRTASGIQVESTIPLPIRKWVHVTIHIDYMPSMESLSIFAASLTLHDSDNKLLYISSPPGSPLAPLREPPSVGGSHVRAVQSVHFRSSFRVMPFESSAVAFVCSLVASRIPLTTILRTESPATTAAPLRRVPLFVGDAVDDRHSTGFRSELATHSSELARQLAMISLMLRNHGSAVTKSERLGLLQRLRQLVFDQTEESPMIRIAALHVLCRVQLKDGDNEITQRSMSTLHSYFRRRFLLSTAPSVAAKDVAALAAGFISILRKKLRDVSQRTFLLQELEKALKLTGKALQAGPEVDSQKSQMLLTEVLATFAVFSDFDDFVVGDCCVVQQAGQVDREGILIKPSSSNADPAVVLVNKQLLTVSVDQLSLVQSSVDHIKDLYLPASIMDSLLLAISEVIKTDYPIGLNVPSQRTLLVSELQARAMATLNILFQHGDLVPKIFLLAPSLVDITRRERARVDCIRNYCKFRDTKSESKKVKKVFESSHPYLDDIDKRIEIKIEGAKQMTVVFDEMSCTEENCDYLRFLKDTGTDISLYWGMQRYSGGRGGTTKKFPGINGTPPLVIEASCCTLLWRTDNSRTAWGWKFTVTAELVNTGSTENSAVMLSLPEKKQSLLQLRLSASLVTQTLYEQPARNGLVPFDVISSNLPLEKAKDRLIVDTVSGFATMCATGAPDDSECVTLVGLPSAAVSTGIFYYEVVVHHAVPETKAAVGWMWLGEKHEAGFCGFCGNKKPMILKNGKEFPLADTDAMHATWHKDDVICCHANLYTGQLSFAIRPSGGTMYMLHHEPLKIDSDKIVSFGISPSVSFCSGFSIRLNLDAQIPHAFKKASCGDLGDLTEDQRKTSCHPFRIAISRDVQVTPRNNSVLQTPPAWARSIPSQVSSRKQSMPVNSRDLAKEAAEMQEKIFALSVFSGQETDEEKEEGSSLITTATNRIAKHKDHVHSFARSVYLRIASYHAQGVLLQLLDATGKRSYTGATGLLTPVQTLDFVRCANFDTLQKLTSMVDIQKQITGKIEFVNLAVELCVKELSWMRDDFAFDVDISHNQSTCVWDMLKLLSLSVDAITCLSCSEVPRLLNDIYMQVPIKMRKILLDNIAFIFASFFTTLTAVVNPVTARSTTARATIKEALPSLLWNWLDLARNVSVHFDEETIVGKVIYTPYITSLCNTVLAMGSILGLDLIQSNCESNVKPIMTEVVEVRESEHDYANNHEETFVVEIPGAMSINVEFDEQTVTESGCDIVTFFNMNGDTLGEYSGPFARWPNSSAPLTIPAQKFRIRWYTDGSTVKWGWKCRIIGKVPVKPKLPDNADESKYSLVTLRLDQVRSLSMRPRSQHTTFSTCEVLKRGFHAWGVSVCSRSTSDPQKLGSAKSAANPKHKLPPLHSTSAQIAESFHPRSAVCGVVAADSSDLRDWSGVHGVSFIPDAGVDKTAQTLPALHIGDLLEFILQLGDSPSLIVLYNGFFFRKIDFAKPMSSAGMLPIIHLANDTSYSFKFRPSSTKRLRKVLEASQRGKITLRQVFHERVLASSHYFPPTKLIDKLQVAVNALRLNQLFSADVLASGYEQQRSAYSQSMSEILRRLFEVKPPHPHKLTVGLDDDQRKLQLRTVEMPGADAINIPRSVDCGGPCSVSLIVDGTPVELTAPGSVAAGCYFPRVLESNHPYRSGANEFFSVSFPGSRCIEIRFDKRCGTASVSARKAYVFLILIIFCSLIASNSCPQHANSL